MYISVVGKRRFINQTREHEAKRNAQPNIPSRRMSLREVNEYHKERTKKRKPITLIASGGGGEAVVPKKVRVSLVTWRPIGSMASYKAPCLTSHLTGTEVKSPHPWRSHNLSPSSWFCQSEFEDQFRIGIHSDKPKYEIQQGGRQEQIVPITLSLPGRLNHILRENIHAAKTNC